MFLVWPIHSGGNVCIEKAKVASKKALNNRIIIVTKAIGK